MHFILEKWPEKHILWSHFNSFVTYEKELMTLLRKQNLSSLSWKADCTCQDFSLIVLHLQETPAKTLKKERIHFEVEWLFCGESQLIYRKFHVVFKVLGGIRNTFSFELLKCMFHISDDLEKFCCWQTLKKYLVQLCS